MIAKRVTFCLYDSMSMIHVGIVAHLRLLINDSSMDDTKQVGDHVCCHLANVVDFCRGTLALSECIAS